MHSSEGGEDESPSRPLSLAGSWQLPTLVSWHKRFRSPLQSGAELGSNSTSQRSVQMPELIDSTCLLRPKIVN
jgi:hypothetical protein